MDPSADELDLQILDALPDLILVVREGSVRWVNAAAERALGPAVVGRAFDDLLAAGEGRRVALLEGQRKRGWVLPSTCRVRFVRARDGGEVTADVRLGERGPYVVVSARDVTDVTRAEKLMGTLAQMFARGSTMLDADALLDATEPTFLELGWIVGFTEIVPGGSVTRRVIAPPDDPVGQYGRSVIGIRLPFDRTPVLAEVVRTGRAIFLDNLPSLQPNAVPASAPLGSSMERAHSPRSAWCPVITNGHLTHHLAITGRDLTEHDFLAMQLFAVQLGATMHTQALQTALVRKERLAAVGEMAAVMAHEVRNPLGIIFNALAGLQKSGASASRMPELLEIIREEAERLRQLVTNLLDFSRPWALEVQSVELAPLLRQWIDAARLDPSLHGAAREVELDLPVDLPVVDTDPLLLRRAVVNLVMNALQHVSSSGRVSVKVTFDARDAHIRVYNDGPTIRPEIAERVFEPFFTTRPTGSGLGLALARRIVNDLRGRVYVDAEETRGTAFTLVFPIHSTEGVPLR